MIKAFWQKTKAAARAVKETFRLSTATVIAHLGLSASWTTPSYQKLARKAVRNPHSKRAIELIASNMASIPLKVVDADGEDVEGHPVLDLFDRPTPRHSRTWLFHGFVHSLMAGGEFWLHGAAPETGPNAGRPRELRLFHPDQFHDFIWDRDTGFVAGYRLQQIRRGTLGEIKNFDLDEAHHVFTYNPIDRDRGLPLLLAALRALDLMEAGDDWNKSIAEKGGRMPGWFSPTGLQDGQQLSPEQQAAAEKALQDKWEELTEKSKPGVLSGAFEWLKNTIAPKDAEWGDLDKLSARKVGVALGVDPALLGDSENKTYSNMETALKAAYLLTILPLLDFILDELNHWLMPKYGDGLKLTYDKREIEALQEDENQRVDRLNKATGGVAFMTPDEAREELGLDPAGLGEVLLPFNVIPQGEMGAPRPADDTPAARHLGRIARVSDEEFDEAVKELITIEPGGDGA